MPNNVQLNVYQINQAPVNAGGLQSLRIGFPAAGVIIRDTSVSSTRNIAPGISVYTVLQTPDGTQYYVQELFAAVATLLG